MSEHRTGVLGTIIVHTLILILLLLFKFYTPFPFPGEEGILVNFGNSEQGFGIEEPAPAQQRNEAVLAVEETKAVQPPPSSATPPAVSKAKEEVMTQNYEKTVAIESAAEKEAREKQAELDRQRKLAEERQIQEQREKERQAEAARLQREAEQKKIADINSRVTNAFGATGTGAGAADSKSTSQGVTFPGGNQGSPDGSPASQNYGIGSGGSGASGTGPSYSLLGRKHQLLPKPAYPGNEQGVVVVAITVDKDGKVTNAEAGVQGSNTYNTALLQAAKEAALKARFNDTNDDPNAAAFQKGTITYRFVLD
ncbi:MAG: TonB family protein [Mangrovibacterium sp.]